MYKIDNIAFEATENKGIIKACKILMNEFNCSKLASYTVKPSSCRCLCGESYAVEVEGLYKGKTKSVRVGVCERCSNEL